MMIHINTYFSIRIKKCFASKRICIARFDLCLCRRCVCSENKSIIHLLPPYCRESFITLQTIFPYKFKQASCIIGCMDAAFRPLVILYMDNFLGSVKNQKSHSYIHYYQMTSKFKLIILVSSFH